MTTQYRLVTVDPLSLALTVTDSADTTTTPGPEPEIENPRGWPTNVKDDEALFASDFVAFIIGQCCAPYDTLMAMQPNVRSRRAGHTRTRVEASGVNNTADYVDNMWCRDRGAVAARDTRLHATKES